MNARHGPVLLREESGQGHPGILLASAGWPTANIRAERFHCFRSSSGNVRVWPYARGNTLEDQAELPCILADSSSATWLHLGLRRVVARARGTVCSLRGTDILRRLAFSL